jgi:hypothetical protein
MNIHLLEDKDKEIIEGLKKRAETLLAEIITLAKKLNLDATEAHVKNEKQTS